MDLAEIPSVLPAFESVVPKTSHVKWYVSSWKMAEFFVLFFCFESLIFQGCFGFRFYEVS